MSRMTPIYTAQTECQDCRKCIRECPVKAVKVARGYASVISNLCILCGHCVAVCPHGAKKVRDDVGEARHLLTSLPRVIASLAPSFVSEFAHLRPGQLIAALKRLGFWGASETALGAQQVSANIAALMKQDVGNILFSSACPTVVEYIRKYRPEFVKGLTPLLSPLLTHCKMLRTTYGQGIGIVFFGPCIAKKLEAESHVELLDVALTFDDLKRWLRDTRIDPQMLVDSPDDRFVPEAARDGALYPVEGGMVAGVQASCAASGAGFMAFSGVKSIGKALDGLEGLHPDKNLFIELLACEGGCVNGPSTATKSASALKRYQVIQYAQPVEPGADGHLPMPIFETYEPEPVPFADHTDEELVSVLRSVAMYSPEDELNCGGCGYDSCREFARAFLNGKAERSMCTTYMRKLAQKKANALMTKMPAAVVIVDADLKIIECNPSFIRMFVDRTQISTENNPGLEGVELESVVPFSSLFSSVLETGTDIVDRDIRHRKGTIHASIFTIEKNAVAGAILEDITEPSVRKEQIIKRARQVIEQNLKTVQQIAFLIGENAAESEITLTSIVESFTPEGVEQEDA
jgi:iron only hydrogenase large subunit-like protein